MGEYIEASGVKTWVDSWGTDGPPLILMHGGLGSNVEWEPHVPAFAEHFRVLAPERRGHGRTSDAGELTYELMAEDTIALLDQEVGGPAHLVGWSDGGIVGLLVAIRRPDLVAKLVPVSANFTVEGTIPEMLEGFASMPPDHESMAFFRMNHQAMSPDGPDHWPVFFEKFVRMATTMTPIETKDLGSISAPTLVIASDDDIVTLEHTIDLYRAIPNAELAIVPGTSHALVFEKPELVDRLILDFLQNEPAPTMMPVRRAQSHG